MTSADDQLLPILAALNDRSVFAEATFLVRPSVDGRCIFAGVAEKDLLVPTAELKNADQFWQGGILISPVKRWRDDDGTMIGFRPGQILTSRPELRRMTDVPTAAPRTLWHIPDEGLESTVMMMRHDADVFVHGTLLVRRGVRAMSDDNPTLLVGALDWPGPAPERGRHHAPDEIWFSRIVLMPLHRFQDRQGACIGTTIDDILCSHLDLTTLHRLD